MGSFRPTLEDGGPQSSYLGSPYHDTWISAIVHTKSGQLYWVFRGDKVDGKGEARTVMRSSSGKFMEFPAEIPHIKSPLDFQLIPGKGLQYIASDENAKAEILVTDKDIKWQEDGLLDVRGKLVAPGMQLIAPYEREGKAGVQLYYQEHFAVDGTLRGEPAKGFILFEHNYDHVKWHDGAFATGRGTVSAFANQYDDGTSEVGFFFCGGALRSALVVNDKGEELVNTNILNAVTEVGADGAYTSALYTLGDGKKWEFKVGPGMAVDKRKFPGASSASGATVEFSALSFWQFSRVGEKRKIVRGWVSSVAGQLR